MTALYGPVIFPVWKGNKAKSDGAGVGGVGGGGEVKECE